MRPEKLNDCFKPTIKIPGIGNKKSELLEKLAGKHLIDLCLLRPIKLIDRRYTPQIISAKEGVIATVMVKVEKHIKPWNKKSPYKIICSDKTGEIEIIFFRYWIDYMNKTFPINEDIIVSGKIEKFKNKITMTHPDHVGTKNQLGNISVIEPIYSLTAGIPQKILKKSIEFALASIPELPEWINKETIKSNKWKTFRESIRSIHNPTNTDVFKNDSVEIKRLAYDELLANQIELALVLGKTKRRMGYSIKSSLNLRSKIISNLSYDLTKSQQNAIDEITEDMRSKKRMIRLLQGDVGSGKTIVAICAMIDTVESGYQAAIMAPTEILAIQHYETIQEIISDNKLDIKIDLLTGKVNKNNKSEVLNNIKVGRSQIIVGTHALFQTNVLFSKLALIVIDEQHKFGINQRILLSSKAKNIADILIITATPIPRTMEITMYGDLQVSRIKDKPKGRIPIVTLSIPVSKRSKLLSKLENKVENKEQIYWVCPLIEESENLTLENVHNRFTQLKEIFKNKVDLIHGKMNSDEKEKAIKKFHKQETSILVSTTVIEVGVDVPNATIMVIANAERYGLAQLHQLRGRVGRSDKKSYCFLLFDKLLDEVSKERIEIMKKTNDGFAIAEKDLELRGYGEIIGYKQSGHQHFKFADFSSHKDLLELARINAKNIVKENIIKKKEIENLLHVFQKKIALNIAKL